MAGNSQTGVKRAWTEEDVVGSTKRPRLNPSASMTSSPQDYGAREVSPVVLADCPEKQGIWDRLPVGTLYELARISALKNISLEKIPEKQLEILCKNNVDSTSRLLEALGCGPVRIMEEEVADALDFEAESIVLGNKARLEYCMGAKERSGKVHFTATLSMEALIRDSPILNKSPKKSSQTSSAGSLQGEADGPILSLNVPRLAVSCLFSRVFGSHRFLRVKISGRGKYASDACLEELFAWSLRPIYIFGREYRAFVEKDDTIWYYLQGKDLVGEFAERRFRRKRGQYGLGQQISNNYQLIQWWIPLYVNEGQLMCKLTSRLHLGISGTTPGPLIPDVTIHEDITREVDGKEVVFTDGSGLISEKLAEEIREKCAKDKSRPAAYQIRLSTSKGVVQVATEVDQAFDIIITKSMLKAKHEGPMKPVPEAKLSILEVAHNLACVVKSATCRYPARLSFQLIPILHEQGVPLSAIEDLQKRTVLATLQDLRIPDVYDPKNLTFMKAIQRYARLVYNTLLESHIYMENIKEKYAWKQDKKWMLEEFLASLDKDDSTPNHADVILCPNTQLYLAVTCGLNIRGSEYFMKIWKKLLRKAVKSVTMSFKIEVPGSIYCTIIPDFTGQLEENEISFSPPSEVESADMDFTRGEVLVGRHPAYLPTDVRKVRLANIPTLRKRRGVIYFSTKGRRPLADLLAGGDYDGDDVILIWEPSLVTNFKNADVTLSIKPSSVEACFYRDPVTAGEVHQTLAALPEKDRPRVLEKYLLASLRVPILFGIYNTYFLRAVHVYGIGSEEARVLGHKFNTLIDAQRTSFRLTSEAKKQDEHAWGKYVDPLWKREKDKFEQGKDEAFDRKILPNTTSVNVLDELYKSGVSYYERAWEEVIGKGGDDCIYDPIQTMRLASPWTIVKEQAKSKPELEAELELIKEAVDEARRRFAKIQSKHQGKGLSYLSRQNETIELATWFENNPPARKVPIVSGPVGADPLQAVRAACAFQLDSTQSTGSIGTGATNGFCWIMGIVPLLKTLTPHPITIPFSTFARMTPHQSFCENPKKDDRR